MKMRQSLSATRYFSFLTTTSLVAFVLLAPTMAIAQSGSRGGGQPPAGSGARSTSSSVNRVKPALDGYCPVCIIDMKKWVRGDAAFQSRFDGHTYLFPGQEQKAKFDANPGKYTPVLGGDCVVAYKKMGERVNGSVRHAAFGSGRLFLFSNEMAKNEFVANIEEYTNVDLALAGKCSVCRVEMKKEIEGKPEFEVMHRGIRYRFPGKKQMDMFVASPAKYVAAPPVAAGSGAKGSGAKGSGAKGGSATKGSGQGSSTR